MTKLSTQQSVQKLCCNSIETMFWISQLMRLLFRKKLQHKGEHKK